MIYGSLDVKAIVQELSPFLVGKGEVNVTGAVVIPVEVKLAVTVLVQLLGACVHAGTLI